ncbi:MAG: hypothetical protein SV062_12940 [Thermodesulfobacteriota bacterium]|nr:hypothetical protein [Thermodesulfobacteriota bacterium]
MGIGEDIKSVYNDVGSSYNVLRDDGDLSGEYCVYKINRQVTKPFIQEFFLEAQLPYDTEIKVGDLLEFQTDGRVFLLMNKNPMMFEDEIVNYQGILYKCNVSGELFAPSGEVWDAQTYQKTTQWNQKKAICYGLQTEPLFGHDLETDEELGQIGVERHQLFVSNTVGIETFDRYEPVSGEYYKVEEIRKRRFPGVDVVELSEDMR